MNQPLRFLFFSSSLEPGRDGVGDYVRLLAEACARQGHTCAIVALNDTFATGVLADESKADGAISTVRLPSTLSWAQRVKFVREFRERFCPDWISFNLVPYAFNRKGILLGVIETFRSMTEGARLHLMLHEMYLGAGRPAPFQHHVVGRIQSHAIKRLLARLKPEVITVSNPVHAAMVRSLQADARILPLFGNVPVIATAPVEESGDLPSDFGMAPENRASWFGVFFGAMHEQWKPEPFFGILLRAAQRAGKRVVLVLAGRSSRSIWTELKRDYAGRIDFADVGEQPTSVISWLLRSADFGIACSPWQLIGKSGTVAAMLDHGLPVIVTRDDFQPVIRPDQPPSSDPLLYQVDENLEGNLVTGLPKRAPRARVDEIAAQLAAVLQQTPAVR